MGLRQDRHDGSDQGTAALPGAVGFELTLPWRRRTGAGSGSLIDGGWNGRASFDGGPIPEIGSDRGRQTSPELKVEKMIGDQAIERIAPIAEIRQPGLGLGFGEEHDAFRLSIPFLERTF
ncbi:hypothetical protein [Methylobacterium iners]|uniref:hypothetical protein n=1 Tax=Methylobacterium iners TaxID=418707 RepID=UPI0027963143|nr:hypothetical protein [Methylobacterium iners]